MFFRPLRLATIGLLTAGAFALCGGRFAVAQDAGSGSPEVTVDLNVLDSANGHTTPPHHRNIVLHPPHGMQEAAADKPPPASKHAKTKTTASKRAATHHEKHAKAKRPPDRKHADAHGKTTDADRAREQARIKREEAERIREAKAEIEQAARQASPPPAIQSEGKIPVLGPGPATPPAPSEAASHATPSAPAMKKAPAPAAQSGQVATVTTPPASQPAPPSPAPARTVTAQPKPAKLERRGNEPAHVDFTAGTADLTPGARTELDAVAKTLAADHDERVQLVAYATGSNDEANQARRLSLSRALNVRAYLIDHGVRNTRMDVRALGNRPDGDKPADRVEILFLGK